MCINAQLTFFDKMNTKIDINYDIARVGILNYMLLAHYIGFIESMKYMEKEHYFESDNELHKNQSVTTSKIVDSFSERYNVYNISKGQLNRILRTMILDFDNKGFFGCKN